MSLCLLLGGKEIIYATAAFTLAWTHSVEKTRWEEDWQITPRGLQLMEARVEGSGAGMEPPADAQFDGRFWRYHPGLAPQPELVLARSGATGGSWQICFAGACHGLPETTADDPAPASLAPCP